MIDSDIRLIDETKKFVIQLRKTEYGGNDAKEDLVAAELGMKVFLLTDYLINKNGTDLSNYPHGGFEELQKWLKEQLG